MLFGEGQADDCDCAYNCEEQVSQCDPDSSDEDPYDVHDCGESAGGLVDVADSFAEGQKREERELDGLDTEGDADYRQAQSQAANNVLEEQDDSAAQNDPEHVTE